MAITGSPSTHVSPRPEAPQHSLLDVATQLTLPNEEWLAGLGVIPFGNPDGDLGTIGCAPGEVTYNQRIGELECDPILFDPFVVYATDESGLFRYATDEDDVFTRARLNREAIESKRVEHQFWTDPLGLTNFVALDETGDTAASAVPLSRFTLVVANAIASRTGGGPATIHVRPGIYEWLESNQYTRDGVTHLGHKVVAGPGYLGTGPAGQAADLDSEWAYVTSEVFYVAGPVDSLPDSLTEAVAVATNDATATSMRAFAVGFDTSALHFAVELDTSE